jgi:murein DD-endopeptidase MepM/ murein hydrolase activator NlpD
MRTSRTAFDRPARGAVFALPALALRALALLALALLALALPAAPLCAQTAYRYRDANGQWVFTDSTASAAGPAGNLITLPREPEPLHVSVDRADTATTTQLVATNHCLCVITLRVSITQSDFADLPVGASYRATLPPGAQQMLAQAHRTPNTKTDLEFSWKGALGPPGALHRPPRPYRVPFAVGSTFTVSQAYPTRATHVTAESQYAVDFALPDDTPVYAAREGTVINVRHDSFRGAPLPSLLDQANVIEILHDDGTIAVYAHLHWDSIRVHIGEHVARGEYIANSGNTGFTTGPHLHFAVLRNDGTADVSVPVQFAGIDGAPMTPVTAVPMTAY